jgi:hypothetical protein
MVITHLLSRRDLDTFPKPSGRSIGTLNRPGSRRTPHFHRPRTTRDRDTSGRIASLLLALSRQKGRFRTPDGRRVLEVRRNALVGFALIGVEMQRITFDESGDGFIRARGSVGSDR